MPVADLKRALGPWSAGAVVVTSMVGAGIFTVLALCGSLSYAELAIPAQAGVAAALALTGAFGALLTYIGSSLLVFTGLAVASVYLVRRRPGWLSPDWQE